MCGSCVASYNISPTTDYKPNYLHSKPRLKAFSNIGTEKSMLSDIIFNFHIIFTSLLLAVVDLSDVELEALQFLGPGQHLRPFLGLCLKCTDLAGQGIQ